MNTYISLLVYYFSEENGLGNLSTIGCSQPQKIPYPKRVFLILANEFCERFNFYGMKGKIPGYFFILQWTQYFLIKWNLLKIKHFFKIHILISTLAGKSQFRATANFTFWHLCAFAYRYLPHIKLSIVLVFARNSDLFGNSG